MFNIFDDKSHHVTMMFQLASRSRKVNGVKSVLIKSIYLQIKTFPQKDCTTHFFLVSQLQCPEVESILGQF